jgi:hypothetical protein
MEISPLKVNWEFGGISSITPVMVKLSHCPPVEIGQRDSHRRKFLETFLVSNSIGAVNAVRGFKNIFQLNTSNAVESIMSNYPVENVYCHLQQADSGLMNAPLFQLRKIGL